MHSDELQLENRSHAHYFSIIIACEKACDLCVIILCFTHVHTNIIY